MIKTYHIRARFTFEAEYDLTLLSGATLEGSFEAGKWTFLDPAEAENAIDAMEAWPISAEMLSAEEL